MPYGSMGYSSPEQAAGQVADHRTDVFSLGVVLYEMVTGQPPFRGRHAVEVLNAVINATPRPIAEVNPRALPALQPILDRALAKAPQDRFQTMAAFRDELKALMRRLARETGLVPDGDRRRPSSRRSARAPPGCCPARSAACSAGCARRSRASAERRVRSRAGRRRPAAARSGAPRRGPPSRSCPSATWPTTPTPRFYEFSLADGVITELAGVRPIVVRPSAYIAPYVGLRPSTRARSARSWRRGLVLSGGFVRTPGADARHGAAGRRPHAARSCGATRSTSPRATCSTCRTRSPSALLAGPEAAAHGRGAGARSSGRSPRSPEAYEFYLRGRDALFRYILRTHDEADLDEAVQMLHEAIGLDPEFARAHATLGRCYVLYAQGWGGSENFVLAERSLKHALALDPTMVNARLQMVYVDLHHGDKDKARARVEELLAGAPDDPSVLFVAAHAAAARRARTRRRSRLYDRLLEVNPQDLVLVAINRARIFTHQGRFEEAVAEIDRGPRGRARAPAAQDLPGGGPLQPGHDRRRPVPARGRAAAEPPLRRRAAARSAGACRRGASTSRPARSSPTACARWRPPTTTSRCGSPRSTRWRGCRGGDRVGQARGAHRQRELPAARRAPPSSTRLRGDPRFDAILEELRAGGARARAARAEAA